MSKIYKFKMMPGPSDADREVTLGLPVGAQFLSFQMQGMDLMAWFLHNDDWRNIENRKFRLFMTGEELPEYPRKYLGTLQMQQLSFTLVVHLFEVWP